MGGTDPPVDLVYSRWEGGGGGGGGGEGGSMLLWSVGTNIVRLLEGFYVEINGIKQILVSLEAEIFADQHIQNPLKSASGKSC